MTLNYAENIFNAIKFCRAGQTIWQGESPIEGLDTGNRRSSGQSISCGSYWKKNQPTNQPTHVVREYCNKILITEHLQYKFQLEQAVADKPHHRKERWQINSFGPTHFNGGYDNRRDCAHLCILKWIRTHTTENWTQLVLPSLPSRLFPKSVKLRLWRRHLYHSWISSSEPEIL